MNLYKTLKINVSISQVIMNTFLSKINTFQNKYNSVLFVLVLTNF